MSLSKGQKAPNFKLVGSDTKEVALNDYKGKNVVVLFFPLAFTGTCTDELCSVRDHLQDYKNLNSEVVAISVDSPFTLAKFKKEQDYNFPLLSDFNKEAATAYGCLHEDFLLGMKGVAKRSAFVIDKDGMVQYTEVLDDPHDLPNFDAIQNTLKSIS